jgi:hypothetical protein
MIQEEPVSSLQALDTRCVCFHAERYHISIREAPACTRCRCIEFRPAPPVTLPVEPVMDGQVRLTRDGEGMHNSPEKTMRIGDRIVCFCDSCVEAADVRNAQARREMRSLPCGWRFGGMGAGRR